MKFLYRCIHGYALSFSFSVKQCFAHLYVYQAYTSQIVVMAMLALAIGGDTISSQARREAIIDGLVDLPSTSFWLHLIKWLNFILYLFTFLYIGYLP